jgi:hypothetical protein
MANLKILKILIQTKRLQRGNRRISIQKTPLLFLQKKVYFCMLLLDTTGFIVNEKTQRKPNNTMSKRTTTKKVVVEPVGKSTGKAKGAMYINPLTDFGFKKLFSDLEVLPPFLNATVRPDSPIVKVELRPTEQLGDWESERKAVVDLLCTNERGEFFLVEMQYAPQKHFAERLLFSPPF